MHPRKPKPAQPRKAKPRSSESGAVAYSFSLTPLEAQLVEDIVSGDIEKNPTVKAIFRCVQELESNEQVSPKHAKLSSCC